MNADQVVALRALLAPTGWVDRTAWFGRALRARTSNGLLVMGPQAAVPWHMTAHLTDETRLAGLPAPTLVRWAPPPGAPPHLSVGLDRLLAASRHETVLVVSQALAPAHLLDRVHDVRRNGVTVFALDQDDPELDGLAHEFLAIPADTSPVSFDAAQHLISAAVGEDGGRSAGGGHRPGRGPDSIRTRLARLLDSVSGPATE
jgi:hypothetical protein